MQEEPLRLVVLGDSLAYFDDNGPQLPSHPDLYPNIVARYVEREIGRPVSVNTIAEPGSTVRSTWRSVTKDPHVQFEVLMGADAVIVGVGSFDHAPVGVPPSIEALVPFVRPASLRRRVRKTLRTIHPFVIKWTRGRWTRTPEAEFARMFDAVLFHVRSLTQGAAGVALGPASHRSEYYAHIHPHREARERLQVAIAGKHRFPIVASWPLVEPFVDQLNRDGMHWGAKAHRVVGEALAHELVKQLRGEAPKPAAPVL
ncbi:MAG: SGNH/GDSL hydrolase family protein [Actinomycetota bacterium]|nr:hypothetical protein [Actinomycetota bacterium]